MRGSLSCAELGERLVNDEELHKGHCKISLHWMYGKRELFGFGQIEAQMSNESPGVRGMDEENGNAKDKRTALSQTK